MKLLWTSLKLFLWLTFVTGVAYPLLITLFAQLFFKEKADGKFVSTQGKTVGSLLIGQKFESDKYFWPRPSAVDYNPLPSGGSNLSATSLALQKAVDTRKSKLQTSLQSPPSDLLFASGSGVDPHISPAAARFQAQRIATARNLSVENVEALIDRHEEGRTLGFIGAPRINVLLLNLALDEMK